MRAAWALLLISLALSARAATIDVRVQDGRGGAIKDAVVYAVPVGRQLPLMTRTAVMDQKNRMFIPHILAVQTGTAVSFPNSDDVRHHVYSFSPAKAFQLPLYKGTPASPVVFDKSGVVTLGCNIHDQMSAFIVVVDTPYFDKTGGKGSVTLRDLEPGRYEVHAWTPDMRDPQTKQVVVTSDQRIDLMFVTHGHP